MRSCDWDESFKMKPAAHVPPCEDGEMTKVQRAVVERYREQQAAIDRANSKSKGPELVYSAGQQRALELVDKCAIAQRDGYDTVR